MPAGPSGAGNADAASGKDMSGPGMGQGGNRTRKSKAPAKRGLSVIGPAPKSKTKKATTWGGLSGVRTPGLIDEEVNKSIVSAGGYSVPQKKKDGTFEGATEPSKEFKDANPGLAADPMGLQNAWNAEVRGTNGIGVSIGDGEKVKVTRNEQIGIYQATGVNKAQLRQGIAANRRGLASTVADFGSFVLAGIDAPLSIDEEATGVLGLDKSYSPVDQTLGFMSKATSPFAAGLSLFNGANSFAGKYGKGLYSNKSYDSFQTFAEANADPWR